MLEDRMLRQLMRERLNSGADAASIRAEFEGMGLNAEQIRTLALDVGGVSDSPYAGIEKLYEWLPLAMLIPGSAALGVMAAMMPRRDFGMTCIAAGGVISVVCWRLARR